MSHSSSLHLATLVAAALVLAGCGSDKSTGTKSQTITPVVAAQQLQAGIDTTDTARAYITFDMQLALAALAVGAPPVPMQARVNGVATTFQTVSFGWVFYETGATAGFDSIVATVGWRGDSASEGFLAVRAIPTDQNGQPIPGEGLAIGEVDYWNGRRAWVAQVGSETSMSMTDRKTTCTGNLDVDPSEAQDWAYIMAGDACSTATFSTSGTVTVPAFAGTPGATGNVELALGTQALRGIRVRFDNISPPSRSGGQPLVPLWRTLPLGARVR